MKKLLLILSTLVLTACSSKEVLLRDLTERDANEVVSVLYQASIDSEKEFFPKTKNFSVSVRSSDLPQSVAVLQAVGLPKVNHASINEIFKSTGFAPTPFEERVRYVYGITQELERTISIMDGVLQNRVHVVIPENNSRKQEKTPAKASIFISYDEKYNLDLEIPRIKRLVSESIEGLSANDVEILTTPVKVDLKKIARVPLVNFLGIRIHSHDFIGFIVLLSLLVATIAGLLYTQSTTIITWIKSYARK